MGRVFVEHPAGDKVYSCKKCKADFTNSGYIESTHYQGPTGRAVLFKRAVNVVYGRCSKRNLTSGKHWVRDAHCKKCNTRVGWFYEMAMTEEQIFKEGKVVLEKMLMDETDGLPDEEGPFLPSMQHRLRRLN